MAIRSDISIDWISSPRIITVASPSVELTMQDLLDTLRAREDDIENMGYKSIVDGSGKQNLGGGTKVGITIQLLNAKVAFEARPGPDWVLCSLIGGNLVAIDEFGGDIDPRHPTAFVTIDRTSSASATLQEQDALQYSSFGGGVSVDVVNGISGRDYPAGNQEYPVDNMADAIFIADDRGFRKLFIREPMEGADAIDTPSDLDGFTIIGDSSVNTKLEINPGASCRNLTIRECDVFGTLDGSTHLVDCKVGEINYVNGHIDHCGLYGNIYLGGSKEAVISNCYIINQDLIPVVDMGGSGQDLAMPNYSGLVIVRNLTSGTEEIGIGLNAGMAIIEPTVTAGTIIIGGNGMVQDFSGENADVNIDGLMNKQAISEALLATPIGEFDDDGSVGLAFAKAEYGGTISVEAGSGNNGQSYPMGTHSYPVETIADAVALATKYDCHDIHIHDDFTIPTGSDLSEMRLSGSRSGKTTITIEPDVITTDTLFTNLQITGESGCSAVYENCLINDLTEICGSFYDCQFDGNNAIQDELTTSVYMRNCSAKDRFGTIFDVGRASISFQGWVSRIFIANKYGPNSVNINFTMGWVTANPDCVDGSINMSGTGYCTDLSAAGCNVNQSKLNNKDIQAETILDAVA